MNLKPVFVVANIGVNVTVLWDYGYFTSADRANKFIEDNFKSGRHCVVRIPQNIDYEEKFDKLLDDTNKAFEEVAENNPK